MRTIKYIEEFIKNNNSENLQIKRNIVIDNLLNYEDYQSHNLFGYDFYINEKLGYNSSLVKYIDIIIDKIENRDSDSFDFYLKIDQFLTSYIKVDINNNDTSIHKNGDILIIKLDRNDLINLRSVINHELHHIFIISKGHKTNIDYFTTNDLISKTSGKTKAFLTLLYLSFSDELNSNIQMFHSQIGENNIKNKSQFLEFLNKNPLYNISIKMKNIDIHKYWKEIIKEGNDKILINGFNITKLEKWLDETESQIIKSGDEYIRKMSRIFI